MRRVLKRTAVLMSVFLIGAAIVCQKVSSTAQSAKRPNVLIILLDDAGYAQTSTFGALIPTPTLDGLAANGLRYTRFHDASLCSYSEANHPQITQISQIRLSYNEAVPPSAFPLVASCPFYLGNLRNL